MRGVVLVLLFFLSPLRVRLSSSTPSFQRPSFSPSRGCWDMLGWDRGPWSLPSSWFSYVWPSKVTRYCIYQGTLPSHSVLSSSLWPHGHLWPWDYPRQAYWSGLPFPSPQGPLKSHKNIKPLHFKDLLYFQGDKWKSTYSPKRKCRKITRTYSL